MKPKIKKRYGQLLLNSNLKSKLLWVYFILILLPMGYFTIFTHMRVSNVLEEQTLTVAQKNFEDIHAVTQRTISELDSMLEILTQDELVYQIASLNPIDYPLIMQYTKTQQLATSFYNLQKTSSTDRIRLYVDNDFIYSQENRYIFSLDSVRNSGWYKKLHYSGNNTMWFSPDDFNAQAEDDTQWFTSVRMIYDPDSILTPLAILRVDISADSFNKLFQATPVTENSNTLLLKNNIPLLHSGEDILSSTAYDDFKMFNGLETDKWNILDIDSKKCYIRTKEIGTFGWLLATSIPFDDIFSVTSSLGVEMLFTMLAVGIFAYFVAFMISNSSLLRITRLAHSMELVKNGNLDVRISVKGTDEIGQLMDGFNQMMEKIDALATEKYENGRQIKGLELKALQAQINPHFLYNSLDLINCVAIQNEVPEITLMVNALAKFYKLSLNSGCDVIALKDEFMHSRLYIQIQNIRFQNRIQAQWDIDESLLNCGVIKIILQPIIENAIIHGIFERQDKSGIIKISCVNENDVIVIRISDNGIGMDEETVFRNFVKNDFAQASSVNGGYGIRNIQDRLRLIYGVKYGIECKSILGQGTTVTLKIPFVKENNTGS